MALPLQGPSSLVLKNGTCSWLNSSMAWLVGLKTPQPAFILSCFLCLLVPSGSPRLARFLLCSQLWLTWFVKSMAQPHTCLLIRRPHGHLLSGLFQTHSHVFFRYGEAGILILKSFNLTNSLSSGSFLLNNSTFKSSLFPHFAVSEQEDPSCSPSILLRNLSYVSDVVTLKFHPPRTRNTGPLCHEDGLFSTVQ